MSKIIRSEVVTKYIENVQPEYKKMLVHMRKLVLDNVPEVVEVISYGMPLYKYNGKMSVGFAAFKKHCSFIIGGSEGSKILAKELESFKGTKAIIHFTPDHQIPDSVLRKLIKIRLKEIDEGKVWKQSKKTKKK